MSNLIQQLCNQNQEVNNWNNDHRDALSIRTWEHTPYCHSKNRNYKFWFLENNQNARVKNKLGLSHAQKSKNTTQLVPKNRKTLNDKTINNLKNVANWLRPNQDMPILEIA